MINRPLVFRLCSVVGALVLAVMVSGLSVTSASAQVDPSTSTSAQVDPSLFQNLENNYCLNGSVGTDHAEVILTPCNETDKHMQWTVSVYSSGVPGGQLWHLIDDSNDLCLNGYTGTAHAEVTLTPCNGTDNHMFWEPTSVAGGTWVLMNFSASECLNGTLALVYLTPCNTTDKHMQWKETVF
jgi:hypothetical protein